MNFRQAAHTKGTQQEFFNSENAHFLFLLPAFASGKTNRNTRVPLPKALPFKDYQMKYPALQAQEKKTAPNAKLRQALLKFTPATGKLAAIA